MKILISVVVVFFLIIWTSKIKINIEYLNNQNNIRKIKFNINIGIYWLGLIKILGVSLKEDGMKILFFKFRYTKIKLNKAKMKNIKKDIVIEILKKLKLEKLKLNVSLGIEDIGLTVFLTFVISTFLSILPAIKNKQINLKNYYYTVMPVYNRNTFDFDISAKFSIKLINLVKLFTIKKETKTQDFLKNETVKI